MNKFFILSLMLLITGCRSSKEIAEAEAEIIEPCDFHVDVSPLESAAFNELMEADMPMSAWNYQAVASGNDIVKLEAWIKEKSIAVHKLKDPASRCAYSRWINLARTSLNNNKERLDSIKQLEKLK